MRRRHQSPPLFFRSTFLPGPSDGGQEITWISAHCGFSGGNRSLYAGLFSKTITPYMLPDPIKRGVPKSAVASSDVRFSSFR